jgi:hypothetical protein
MKKDEQYSAAEAKKRFDAALRGARIVGHKTQAEMKLGQPRGKKPARKRLTKP